MGASLPPHFSISAHENVPEGACRAATLSGDDLLHDGHYYYTTVISNPKLP